MFPKDAIDAAELSEKSECQILMFIVNRWKYLLLLVLVELLNAYSSLHDFKYLEAHSLHGSVVAKYLKHTHRGYHVHELVSYPVTSHGVTIQKNCSYRNEFFAHKADAEKAIDHVVLGAQRLIYVPQNEPHKDCVAEDMKGAVFSNAMLHLIIAVLCIAIMCFLCRRAKPAPPTAMAIELTASGEHAVSVVSVNATEYAPVGQDETDGV
jgi:hypothetical protein